MPFFQSSGIVPVLHASWKIRVSHSVQELPSYFSSSAGMLQIPAALLFFILLSAVATSTTEMSLQSISLTTTEILTINGRKWVFRRTWYTRISEPYQNSNFWHNVSPATQVMWLSKIIQKFSHIVELLYRHWQVKAKLSTINRKWCALTLILMKQEIVCSKRTKVTFSYDLIGCRSGFPVNWTSNRLVPLISWNITYKSYKTHKKSYYHWTLISTIIKQQFPEKKKQNTIKTFAMLHVKQAFTNTTGKFQFQKH